MRDKERQIICWWGASSITSPHIDPAFCVAEKELGGKSIVNQLRVQDRAHTAWVRSRAFPCCMALRLLHEHEFAVAQISHILTGNNSNTCLIRLLWRTSYLIHIKNLEYLMVFTIHSRIFNKTRQDETIWSEKSDAIDDCSQWLSNGIQKVSWKIEREESEEKLSLTPGNIGVWIWLTVNDLRSRDFWDMEDWLELCVRHLQTFSIKGQIINILGSQSLSSPF